ncbi:MAG: DnaD domain protein, partial [Clostridia bacterium]|nr:DnaD domain protein [Clostridia bacterium]
MNVLIHYGTAVAVVPAAALEVADRATKTDLQVLLTLCAEPTLQVGDSPTACVNGLASRLGCSSAQVEASLSFWRGAGVLSIDCEESTASVTRTSTAEPVTAAVTSETPVSEPTATGKPETSPTPRPRPSSELPRYTSTELADLLETRQEAAAYLQECQNIWGKMFNTLEYNIILALVDYLGLEWDYVLALLSYAAKYYRERENRGKSLSYVENMAFALHKEGIVTAEALQKRFKEMEDMATLEFKLRKLFGMGEGEL